MRTRVIDTICILGTVFLPAFLWILWATPHSTA